MAGKWARIEKSFWDKGMNMIFFRKETSIKFVTTLRNKIKT